MRGTLRWARADLRARRGQALITVAVVAGVVTALMLATMLLQGAVNPWQQLFSRTHGADALIYFQNGTNTRELRYVAGIREIGQALPGRVGDARAERGEVTGRDAGDDVDAARHVRAAAWWPGTWLRPSAPDGVVLEASFAQAVHVGSGMRITVLRHRRHQGADAGDRHRGHLRPGLLPAVDARPDLGAARAAGPGGAESERDPGGRRPAPVRQLRGGHRAGRPDHLEPLQRLGRVLGRRALLHLAAGEGLDGQQRPAARAAARAVRDHRASRRPVRHRRTSPLAASWCSGRTSRC